MAHAQEHRDARLEGQWDQVRGRVRDAWGALTDDDVDRAEGNWTRLIGNIRERTGEAADTIESKPSEILDTVEEKGSRRDES